MRARTRSEANNRPAKAKKHLKDLLETWVAAGGVPDEKRERFPKNITAARTWIDPELGLLGVGSKSDWMLSEDIVKDIDRLIKKLNGKDAPTAAAPLAADKKRAGEKTMRVRAEAEVKQLEARNKTLLGKYQTERALRLSAEQDAKNLEMLRQETEDELERVAAENRKLKAALVERSGFTVV